jgi:hypothetical protein
LIPSRAVHDPPDPVSRGVETRGTGRAQEPDHPIKIAGRISQKVLGVEHRLLVVFCPGHFPLFAAGCLSLEGEIAQDLMGFASPGGMISRIGDRRGKMGNVTSKNMSNVASKIANKKGTFGDGTLPPSRVREG